ncbi:hypothetical protein T484DRAFT_1847223, partial [Baffinella frigidus]
GFALTIYGSKFQREDASAAVGRLGGGQRACHHTTWVSQSKVTCVAPPGVGSHLPVTYSARHAPVAATFGAVSFDYDPPVVTSVSVSTGPVGGGLRVTLTGFGFGLADTDPTVEIGAAACAGSQWTSDSSLSCATPAGRGTRQPIAVDVGGQKSLLLKSSPLFDYEKSLLLKSALKQLFDYEGPSISAAWPHSSPTAGGVEITLFSKDFEKAPPLLPPA